MRLEIEPVPHASWGLSLANLLPREDWDKLRTEAYRRSKYRCSICGDTSELEAHETWKFNLHTKVQQLVDILCLCKKCHGIKHFGRSKVVGPKSWVEELIKHWCKVNKKSKEEFEVYQRQIFEVNKKRKDIIWTIKVGKKVLY